MNSPKKLARALGLALTGATTAIFLPDSLAQSPPSLSIHTVQIAPGSSTQFRFTDTGTGASGYAVEFSATLGAGISWGTVGGAVITGMGGGLFQVTAPGAQGQTGFYRVRGIPGSVVANFVASDFTVLEGATTEAAISLSAPFFGTLFYSVGGTAESGDHAALTGQVAVNGTTAVIPVALNDNFGIGEFRDLTLRLEAGAGYQVGTESQRTIAIDENDADWQGSLIIGKSTIGFVLRIQKSGTEIHATLRSIGFGLFPTNEAPGTVTMTASAFQANFTGIPMAPEATHLNAGMSLQVDLNAVQGQPNQAVAATQMQGTAAMITRVAGRSYLNHTNRGSFVLVKSPVARSTGQLELTSQP